MFVVIVFGAVVVVVFVFVTAANSSCERDCFVIVICLSVFIDCHCHLASMGYCTARPAIPKPRLSAMTAHNRQSRLQLTTKETKQQQQAAILFMVVSMTLK